MAIPPAHRTTVDPSRSKPRWLQSTIPINRRGVGCRPPDRAGATGPGLKVWRRNPADLLLRRTGAGGAAPSSLFLEVRRAPALRNRETSHQALRARWHIGARSPRRLSGRPRQRGGQPSFGGPSTALYYRLEDHPSLAHRRTRFSPSQRHWSRHTRLLHQDIQAGEIFHVRPPLLLAEPILSATREIRRPLRPVH
jgi:hypothetical protein